MARPTWRKTFTPNCLRKLKKLTATRAKYGAPQLEMYAAYHFIVKNHSYLCPRKFTLRVDTQALSWLKTYSTDQALIGRWIMALEKYHFLCRTSTSNTTSQCRWPIQTNQRLSMEKTTARQTAFSRRTMEFSLPR